MYCTKTTFSRSEGFSRISLWGPIVLAVVCTMLTGCAGSQSPRVVVERRYHLGRRRDQTQEAPFHHASRRSPPPSDFRRCQDSGIAGGWRNGIWFFTLGCRRQHGQGNG